MLLIFAYLQGNKQNSKILSLRIRITFTQLWVISISRRVKWILRLRLFHLSLSLLIVSVLVQYSRFLLIMPNPPSTKSTTSSQATAEPHADPHPEPGPDWEVATQIWGVAWQVHWAGFGIIFSMLALRSLIALAQVRKREGFGRKPLVVAINVLVLTQGVTRALFLFLDPYESRTNGLKVPPWLTNLLYGITFPCLTSSFCLIHLAFIEVSKVQIGSKKLQSVSFLSVVITIHFAIVVTAEIVTAMKAELTPLIIVCQSLFILWGFLLSTSFIYSGLKVIQHDLTVQRELQMVQIGTADRVGRPRQATGTIKVAKITLATSILGFACCGLQLYSLFGVYSLYSKVVNPAPWPWWIFQTCFRLVEFFMACTIAYSVMQRSSVREISKTNNHSNDISKDIIKPGNC